ncbi:flavodoxin domain-containing protein [Lacticaseibacillus nasuensis]|uniref:flavodoxin domain-containing protein n=1 Tax=Lacticaseibacillus nasuensis TaxID=944671 RepID=UPI00224805EA|nr:flavodoxin domain-containing protein [Lacticaseibacillus nasuensis]MCX2455756.1 hypothetical protein [Lacticaseibacillus nasuensis]
MADAVVVYTSQTGFTQRFAMQIAKRMHCPVLDIKFVTPRDLTEAQLVVYGGHMWAGRVGGFRAFYRQFKAVLPSRLLVFGTGVEASGQIDYNAVRRRCFVDCQGKPQFFYFHGHIDPRTLPLRLKLVAAWQSRRDHQPACSETGEIAPLLAAVRMYVDEADMA